MYQSNRLVLFHCWVAFGLFLPAVMLGFWQMLMRSPPPAPLDDPVAYYASGDLARHGDGPCADHVLYYGFWPRGGQRQVWDVPFAA